jgi:dihydroxyacetone kinase
MLVADFTKAVAYLDNDHREQEALVKKVSCVCVGGGGHGVCVVCHGVDRRTASF